jgi:hypothetical protein
MSSWPQWRSNTFAKVVVYINTELKPTRYTYARTVTFRSVTRLEWTGACLVRSAANGAPRLRVVWLNDFCMMLVLLTYLLLLHRRIIRVQYVVSYFVRFQTGQSYTKFQPSEKFKVSNYKNFISRSRTVSFQLYIKCYAQNFLLCIQEKYFITNSFFCHYFKVN